MERDQSSSITCCKIEDNITEIDGFYTCTKCGYTQDNMLVFGQGKIPIPYFNRHRIEPVKNDHLVHELCELASVSDEGNSIACNLFNRWLSTHPNLHKNTLKATALYYACKKTGYPRSLREISAYTGVCWKRIGYYEKLLCHEHIRINPTDYVNRFCVKLDLDFEFIKQTISLIKSFNFTHVYNPVGIAAAAIYMTYIDIKPQKVVNIRDIENVTGCSYTTFKRISKTVLKRKFQ